MFHFHSLVGVLMRIKLFNKSSKNIIVRINGFDQITMSSMERREIVVPQSDEIFASVRKEEDSHLEKKVFQKIYKLTVKTNYTIKTQGNEEINLIFIIQSVRVSGDAYYERVIIKGGSPICQSNSVCNTEEVKKIYKRRWLFYQIFISPFEYLTSMCVTVVVLTVVFAVIIGIPFSILFFFISYAVILFLNCILGKFSDSFFRKFCKLEDEKTEFLNLLSPKFVNDFYTGSFNAYNGEINLDEI